MNSKFLPVLLASAFFPLAAQAQDTAPAPGSQQVPAEIQPGQEPAGDMPATTPPAATMDAPAGQTGEPLPQDDLTATEPVVPDTTTTADAGMATDGPFVTVPETGAWRVSDLEGTAVYGADGESIGDIKDVLVNQQGEVEAVLIGVGGFLGIGEKDVAVSMQALEIGPGTSASEVQAMSDTTGTATGVAGTDTTGGMAPNDMTTTGTDSEVATGATGSTMEDPMMPGMSDSANDPAADYGTGDQTAAVQIGEDGLPDRIVLNVTREQLENAPAFEGVQPETMPQ